MNLWIVPLAVTALAAGCITIPGKPSAAADDGGVNCSIPEPGDASFCQVATNLGPKQVTNQTSLCTSMHGTVVPACPDDAVGCCATTSGAVDFNQCFYGISVAAGEQTCAGMSGTWTAGSAASDAGETD
jgi:hypothetical protein